MTDYITSANFKTRHGITTTTNDARIAAHITAASLEVDSLTGRQFGPGAAAARYFRPDSAGRCRIDDCHTVTALATDTGDTGAYGTTWATTDYETEWANGIGPNGQTGWPIVCLVAVGSLSFPTGNRRRPVKVTATWGWAAIPTDIVEATYLIAHRLYYEVAVPSGLTPPNVDFGLPGSPLQRPYTVERLLDPYIRADRKLGIAG